VLGLCHDGNGGPEQQGQQQKEWKVSSQSKFSFMAAVESETVLA
jgi:hypothetical protein